MEVAETVADTEEVAEEEEKALEFNFLPVVVGMYN